MATTMQDLGIDQFSAEQRLHLLGEIWDSLELEEVPIPESHQAELDRRLASAEADPGASRPWEEVRARLRDEQ